MDPSINGRKFGVAPFQETSEKSLEIQRWLAQLPLCGVLIAGTDVALAIKERKEAGGEGHVGTRMLHTLQTTGQFVNIHINIPIYPNVIKGTT